MKSIRYHLLVLALAAATLGPALLGSGAAPTANVLAGPHITVSTASAAGKSTKLVAIKRYPPCSIPGIDC